MKPSAQLYANREYVRNQLRSTTPDNVLSRLYAILRRHRGAVLNGNRKGLKAMGEELKALGGRDAMRIGNFTIPINPRAGYPGSDPTLPGRFTLTKTEKIILEEWKW
jgi:hypothetical protein